MEIIANAKINLCLNIDGIFNDGWHRLDMVMQEISLADVLSIELTESGIEVEGPSLIPKVNTMSRAAEEFFSFTGISGGVRIGIVKNIPDQAGLGGGSSDAAAVINALDCLADTRLCYEEKKSIGIKVGSDVPFFINGGCARVSGRGDEVTSVKNMLDPYIVLAKPEGGVSTAEAYRRYDDMKCTGADVRGVISSLNAGDMEGYAKATGNSLYLPAVSLNPDIEKVMELLCDADFHMMTGSGSCVFAFYSEREKAESARLRAAADKTVSFTALTGKADR